VSNDAPANGLASPVASFGYRRGDAVESTNEGGWMVQGGALELDESPVARRTGPKGGGPGPDRVSRLGDFLSTPVVEETEKKAQRVARWLAATPAASGMPSPRARAARAAAPGPGGPAPGTASDASVPESPMKSPLRSLSARMLGAANTAANVANANGPAQPASPAKAAAAAVAPQKRKLSGGARRRKSSEGGAKGENDKDAAKATLMPPPPAVAAQPQPNRRSSRRLQSMGGA